MVDNLAVNRVALVRLAVAAAAILVVEAHTLEAQARPMKMELHEETVDTELLLGAAAVPVHLAMVAVTKLTTPAVA